MGPSPRKNYCRSYTYGYASAYPFIDGAQTSYVDIEYLGQNF